MAGPFIPGTSLTQDELDRAIAMSQGRAMDPPAPMPEPVPPPQAMETPVSKASRLTPDEEARFQHDMREGDGYKQWREEFATKYGGEPNLDDPDYDYRAAWKSGIRPARYEYDGTYHWASSAPDGSMLKSENHPTAWMEHFMRATGKDPNEVGVKSKEEGEAYIASMDSAPATGASMSTGLAPVERPEGRNRRQNIAQLEEQQLDVANERLANIPNLGDEKGMTAESYKRMAAENQRGAEQSKATAAEARTAFEESTAREAVARQRAESLWNELESSKQPPPDSTTTKVLGVIGSLLTMGSNKGGTAHGVQMLLGLLGSDKERWAQERAANSDLYKKAIEAADNERATQLDHLNASQKVAALEGMEVLDSLKAIENMGLGERATAFAQDVGNKFKNSLFDGLISGEKEKQKEEQAAAAAAAKKRAGMRDAAQRDALNRMTEEELKMLRDSPTGLSELGHEILAKKIKDRQGEALGDAGIREKNAEAAKKEGEAGGGAGQEILPGYVATIPLEKKDVSDIRANRKTLTDIQRDFSRLNELRQKTMGSGDNLRGYVWKNDTDKVEASNIISGLTGKLNQLVGRGAPSNQELEDMKKQLLDPTDRYALTDPGEVYERTLRRLEDNFNAGIESLGVQRVGGKEEEPPKGPQIMFKPKAAAPNGPAGDAARAYLESRGGMGAGGA